ncbi:MAG: class II fructose-bisphosphate aldolase [Clostridiales bacterium]|jgi:fructose/tagatose bisphosphate aldolase|nr:class II fructose-bisphosphate aldolase [Clostridiales bacterium]
MAFVTDKDQSKAIISAAVGKKVSLALFCTASFWNTEAILHAADTFARAHNIKNIPVVVAMTSNYAHMQQARRVTYSKNAKIGLEAIMRYCKLLCDGPDAPYRNVTAMTHLDHADPAVDTWALTECADLLSSVMFDAQAYPYEENLRMTKDYVKKYGGGVLVEGIVEGLAVGGGQLARQNDDYIDKAVRFVSETGVDFLVADLGTEQQSAGTGAVYLKDRAQSLTKNLGRPMLVLHGVSSLKDEDIRGFSDDGVVRVNMWTRIVRQSGLYAAEQLIARYGKMQQNDFEATESMAYINDNIANASAYMQEVMGQLNYAALAGN